jgi:peptidoglycan/xylan/chitin deacetylase (PgdA/CDA1 family)
LIITYQPTNSNRVLVYHKIDPKPELGLTCLHPRQFRKQIEFLAEKGFRFVTLSELIKRQGREPNVVAIDFDDGYQDVYQYAFPILKEYQAPATVFVISNFIGRCNTWDVNLGWIYYQHLDEASIGNLISAGWEVGSHGQTHRALQGMTRTEIECELSQSKQLLEEKFNQPVHFFAMPFGNVNELIRELASKVGYRGICGFYPFRYYHHCCPPDIIPRLAVYRTDSLKAISNKLGGGRGLLGEVTKQNVVNFCSNATIMANSLR